MTSEALTSWFKDAIVYHILIDRFAGCKTEGWDRPDFLGGNLRGILGKLDYLQDLGVTCIWISPFYKTSAYHGYAVTDFYSVDERFGSEDDLKRLIHEAHKRKMRIIADFVPNHCSAFHPFFMQARANKKSGYFPWFKFTHWPQKYLCFLSVDELPKLNLEHEPCRIHILGAAKKWLSLGLDGYRLDHVIGPRHSFWKEMRKTVDEEFPEAILIGEAWMEGIKAKELKTLGVRGKFTKWLKGSSSEALFKEYIGELHGLLDFRFAEIMREHAEGDSKLRLIRLHRHYPQFPKEFVLPTFLDNHDMDRFLFTCSNDKEKLKEAASIQFSIPQPPIIYYGTEVGMSQQRSMKTIPAYGDLQARQPMKWENQDKEILDFYKQLIQERKKRTE